MLLGAVSALAQVQNAPTVQWRTTIDRSPYVGNPTLVRIANAPNSEYQTLITHDPVIRPGFTSITRSIISRLLSNGEFITAASLPGAPVAYRADQLIEAQDGGFLLAGVETLSRQIFLRKLDAQGSVVWNVLADQFTVENTPNSPLITALLEFSDRYVLTGVFNAADGTNAPIGLEIKKGDVSFGPTYNDATADLLKGASVSGINDACKAIDNGHIVVATQLYMAIKIAANRAVEWSVPVPGQGRGIAIEPTNGGYFALWSNKRTTVDDAMSISRISSDGQVAWTKVVRASGALFVRPEPVILADTDGGVLVADQGSGLKKYSSSGDLVWQLNANFGYPVTSIVKATDGGFLVGGIVNSSVPVQFGIPYLGGRQNHPLITKLSPEQATTPPVTTNLALTAPTYDCITGQLTINTSGGNGSFIEYRIVGNRDWANSNSFFVPAHQRSGTTFNLEARQNGQVVSVAFTTACGTTTTPPSSTTTTPPITPPVGYLFVLVVSPDCNTGQFTAQATNAGGVAVEYRVVGLRDWNSENRFTVPAWQRTRTLFNVEARTNTGAYGNTYILTSCSTVTPPVTPPTGTALSLGKSAFDCGSGRLTLTTSGGNGSMVEYRIPGLADWQTSAVFTVPTYQRQNTNFTVFARQGSSEVSGSFMTNCPTARVAKAEMEQSWSVAVLGNPADDQVQLRLSGLSGQTLGLRVSDATGRVVSDRQVMVQTEGQSETLSLSGSGGVYLIQAISNGQQQTLKIVKK